MPCSYRDETRELNELTRQEAGGSFIRLSDGFTHYELSAPLRPRQGAETGSRAVVLVHGFSVPYFIYDPTFEFLTRSGLHVLRYDLFGRGFSDRPDTEYNLDLFVRQLGELLDELQLPSQVSLVGLSTGGPITAAFTARFPDRVDRLVLIDPVGAGPFFLSRLARAAAAPGLGEAIAGVLGSVRMARRLASSSLDWERIGELGPRYIIPMEFKGFKRALLSTVRNRMLDSCVEVYQQIGRMGKPVMLLWGRQDRTVPFRQSGLLRAAMPQVQFHVIENTGHIPHYEKADQVNPILYDFLTG